MHTSTSLRIGLAALGLAVALTLRAASASAPAVAAAAPAASEASSAPAPATLQPTSDAELAAVAAHIPGARPADLRATPIPGIFEFRQGAELVYVTADGRYGFAGDLYRLADRNNLSDARRRELRLDLLRNVPEASMVVFAPPQPKYTITVFTDVDCAYCRELHKNIAEFNRLGVKVRYLFFPRSGPNTSSWSKAEQVWCAPDRREALTEAKRGVVLKSAVCNPNPVAAQYALGRAIGLTGTPGIVTESGDLLPGYAPPDELVQELQADRPHG